MRNFQGMKTIILEILSSYQVTDSCKYKNN
jgi:hypothetical protein